jgi:hypothetical protein
MITLHLFQKLSIMTRNPKNPFGGLHKVAPCQYKMEGSFDETQKWVAYYLANKECHLHKENEWAPSLECFPLSFLENIQ